MLKGHVQIELHNHKSGSRERIEQENLVTNAVSMLTNFVVGRGASSTDNIMPICSRALGGLMVFEDPLVESVDNVSFPHNNTLIGYAGQTVDTTELERGSINNIETGPVENGYMTVWDFSTAQANGQISSLARTHYLIDKVHPFYSQVAVVAPNVTISANGGVLKIDAENKKVKSLVKNSSNVWVEIEKEVPLKDYFVYHSTNYVGSQVVIDDTNYTSFANRVFSTGGLYYYLNSITRTQNASSSTGYYIEFSFTIINPSNPSSKISKTFKAECPESVTADRFGSAAGLGSDTKVSVSDGYIFTPYIDMKNNEYTINYYVFDANSQSSQTKTINDMYVIDRDISDINIPSTATGSIVQVIPSTKGTCLLVFRDITDSNKYVTILLKSDGAYKKYSRRTGNIMHNNRPIYYEDLFYTATGSGAANMYIPANYLGTICNLQTPFEKTSTTTMKVKYTLLNV